MERLATQRNEQAQESAQKAEQNAEQRRDEANTATRTLEDAQTDAQEKAERAREAKEAVKADEKMRGQALIGGPATTSSMENIMLANSIRKTATSLAEKDNLADVIAALLKAQSASKATTTNPTT